MYVVFEKCFKILVQNDVYEKLDINKKFRIGSYG